MDSEYRVIGIENRSYYDPGVLGAALDTGLSPCILRTFLLNVYQLYLDRYKYIAFEIPYNLHFTSSSSGVTGN